MQFSDITEININKQTNGGTGDLPILIRLKLVR